MYKNILVPIAFEHDKHHEQAIAIARHLLGAGGHMTLLNVVEDIPAYVAGYLPEGAIESNRSTAVAKLDALATKTGKDTSAAVIGGHSHRSIVSYAAEHKIDCIIIASHKPGIEDYFLGSTASHVVRHAKCSVHILR
jgi:nucleotide-binding universal stress UspA family protein